MMDIRLAWLDCGHSFGVADPSDPVQDYDMRGFFKALQAGDPRARQAIDPNDKRLHVPDVWKTPYHETFSRESVDATPNAPYWLENRYLVTPEGQVLYDDAKPKGRR